MTALNEKTHCARLGRRGFTLVELLVTIGIIAVLLGILTPVLGSARTAARRTACLANLRGIGLGVQVFLNENKGLLPRALPLDDSEITGKQGEPRPDSILANLGPTVDTMEVFICPSDEGIPPQLEQSEHGPIGRHCSYEYWPGWLMLFREFHAQDDRPEYTVTKFYEVDDTFPVMADSEARHPGGPVYDQNAVYFLDWRADWMLLGTPAEAVSGEEAQ